jgi:hypothetical protein
MTEVMRHKFSKDEQISGGRIAGTKAAELKIGIHGISPEQRRQNSSRGGVTQGKIQGAANVASGQMEQMRRDSEQARLRWARSEKNRTAARKMGKKYGARVDMNALKTPASLRLGQANGGDKSRHVRWHTNRGIKNFKCSYCLAEFE